MRKFKTVDEVRAAIVLYENYSYDGEKLTVRESILLPINSNFVFDPIDRARLNALYDSFSATGIPIYNLDDTVWPDVYNHIEYPNYKEAVDNIIATWLFANYKYFENWDYVVNIVDNNPVLYDCILESIKTREDVRYMLFDEFQKYVDDLNYRPCTNPRIGPFYVNVSYYKDKFYFENLKPNAPCDDRVGFGLNHYGWNSSLRKQSKLRSKFHDEEDVSVSMERSKFKYAIVRKGSFFIKMKTWQVEVTFDPSIIL